MPVNRSRVAALQLMKNEDLSENQPTYQLIRKKVGSGLSALKAFHPDDIISPIQWINRQPTPTRWTVQCSDDEHGNLLPVELRYINHSCQPNVVFDVDANVVRAIRPIAAGEEFTFFYPSTEWSMDEPFDCNCGAAVCLGRITGASQLSPEVLANYELSGVIRRKLAAAKLQVGKSATT